jgi:hypothetical protein
MRIHTALLSALLVVAGVASAVAAAEITTTGTVVATGRDSLVLRIDDHGHRIPFSLVRPGPLPAGVSVGSRVRVDYHATGVTGQAIDSLRVLSTPPSASTSRQTKHPAARHQAPAAEKVGRLNAGQPNT